MRYLSVVDIIGLHQEIMARYGQSSLLCGDGLTALERALARPQMAAHADLARQAALLIIGLAAAHPFVDGNKRVGFAAGVVMLQLNGYRVRSKGREFAARIVDVLADPNRSNEGSTFDAFTEWLRTNMVPLQA